MLANRERANIEHIEASFRSGTLGQAMKECPQIERRRKLDPVTFERDFRAQGRPVVIEGLMDDWPALREWSFESLAERCGTTRVLVDSYTSQNTRTVTFAEFVDLMRRGSERSAPPIYLQEWLYMADCPSLAQDMPELAIAQYDFRRELYGEKISTNHQLWIGQRGATTRIHQDSYSIDVMHAQIVGERHWLVMSPGAHLRIDESGALAFEELVADARVQMLQCNLAPGEVIYLPTQWWHRIKLLSDAIGQGRKCLDVANLRSHIQLRFAELLPLALNHEAIKEAYSELYEVVMLRNRAWAKLMGIDLTRMRP